jgi:isocitrate dehydrogenase
MNDVRNITELWGHGIADELRDSVHAIAEALPGEYRFVTVDLSYENRKKEDRTLYDEAVDSMRKTGIGFKYPTATIEESPTAIFRKLLKFSVIHRPVTTIPGLKTNFRGRSILISSASPLVARTTTPVR